MRTKVDQALETLEEKHADDPGRALVVRRAREFKASWLNLAEALTGVKRDHAWRGWGYTSFEAYAKAELKLKAETVDKLTGSYMFLHKRAPEVLRRDPLESPIPSYHAVDFLRRAEDRASEEPLDEGASLVELRRRVLDDAAPVATVSRLYKDTFFPKNDADRIRDEEREIRSLATRLVALVLSGKTIRPSLAKRLTGALEELLEGMDDAKVA